MQAIVRRNITDWHYAVMNLTTPKRQIRTEICSLLHPSIPCAAIAPLSRSSGTRMFCRSCPLVLGRNGYARLVEKGSERNKLSGFPLLLAEKYLDKDNQTNKEKFYRISSCRTHVKLPFAAPLQKVYPSFRTKCSKDARCKRKNPIFAL